MEKHNINDVKIDAIINDYLIDIIPAGTKGTIRGHKFNLIVKKTIEDIELDNKRFEVCFEKNNKLVDTNEIPDWYISDKQTGKTLIGMNQLDLWNGGQQINRGYSYLINNKINTKKSKLLCVICIR